MITKTFGAPVYRPVETRHDIERDIHHELHPGFQPGFRPGAPGFHPGYRPGYAAPGFQPNAMNMPGLERERLERERHRRWEREHPGMAYQPGGPMAPAPYYPPAPVQAQVTQASQVTMSPGGRGSIATVHVGPRPGLGAPMRGGFRQAEVRREVRREFEPSFHPDYGYRPDVVREEERLRWEREHPGVVYGGQYEAAPVYGGGAQSCSYMFQFPDGSTQTITATCPRPMSGPMTVTAMIRPM